MTTIKVDKVIPKTGTSIALGDSGDTFTIPSGATFENLGTATGFGAAGIVGVKTTQFLGSSSKSGSNWNEWTEFRLTYTAASTSNRLLFMAQICHANTSATTTIFKFYNNTAGADVANAIADADGSRPRATGRGHNNSTSWGSTNYIQAWVTPINTSANEYTIQAYLHSGTGRINSNSNNADSGTTDNARAVSQFTIIEFQSGIL
tara:strand:- start:38 stop:652 length:615 start_codon:yes stop_codon:yes gene_type:complete